MNMQVLTFIIVGSLFFSCNPIARPDLEKARKEILMLEAKQRTYHLNKNTEAFVGMFSKDFLSVNKGIIDKPSRKDSYEKFNAYFKSVEFVKWNDQEEPIVRFSDDGSIAYVAVNKLVVVKIPRNDGKEITDSTNFAWLTIYKKNKDGWNIDCVASTNKIKE